MDLLHITEYRFSPVRHFDTGGEAVCSILVYMLAIVERYIQIRSSFSVRGNGPGRCSYIIFLSLAPIFSGRRYKDKALLSKDQSIR